MFKSLIFISIVFVTPLCAQEVSVVWGAEQKPSGRNFSDGFLGQTGDLVYTYHQDARNIYLKKSRSSDMVSLWEHTIATDRLKDPNNPKTTMYLPRIEKLKDNFLIILNGYTKDKRYVTYTQLTDADGNLLGGVSLIENDGGIYISYDSTRIIRPSSFHYDSADKSTSRKLVITTFDQQLKQVQVAEASLPFANKKFETRSGKLTKDNDLYIPIQFEIPESERLDKDSQYRQGAFRVSATTGKVTEYDLVIPDKYVKELSLFVDDNGKVKCVGFYSDVSPAGKVNERQNGVVFFSLGDDAHPIASVWKFDKAFVNDVDGKQKENSPTGVNDFEITHFFQGDGGNSTILIEKRLLNSGTNTITTSTTYHTSTGSSTMPGGLSSTTPHDQYYYNNIVSLEFDAQGQMKWYVNIPKRQYGRNGVRFMSYYATYINNKVIIIYNDEEKNAGNIGYSEEMKNWKDVVPVVVSIDESGQFTKRSLSLGQGGKFVVDPKLAQRISDSTAIFRADVTGAGLGQLGISNIRRFGLLRIK